MTNDPANDLLDLFYSFALYLVVEDCYVPDIAGSLLRALKHLDDETGRATVKRWAANAELLLRKQVN